MKDLLSNNSKKYKVILSTFLLFINFLHEKRPHNRTPNLGLDFLNGFDALDSQKYLENASDRTDDNSCVTKPRDGL